MNLFLFLNGIATFLAQNNQKHLCNPRGLFPWVLTSGRWPKSVKRLFDSAKLPRDYKGYVSNVTDRMNPFFIIHTVSFFLLAGVGNITHWIIAEAQTKQAPIWGNKELWRPGGAGCGARPQ